MLLISVWKLQIHTDDRQMKEKDEEHEQTDYKLCLFHELEVFYV